MIERKIKMQKFKITREDGEFVVVEASRIDSALVGLFGKQNTDKVHYLRKDVFGDNDFTKKRNELYSKIPEFIKQKQETSILVKNKKSPLQFVAIENDEISPLSSVSEIDHFLQKEKPISLEKSMAKPTEQELCKALEVVWERLKEFIPEEEQEKIKKEHSVVDEIDEFGAGGPVGLGLGRYGGHAIG